MFKFFIPVIATAFILVPVNGQAEDKKDETPVNPIVQAAEDFSKDFDETSKRHFGVLYSNYNMIKVVESVRDNVEMTAEKCGDVNPDMEDVMDDRYEQWEDAVEPVLEEAEVNVNNMVVAQDYAKPKDIRKFLKMIDDAREEKSEELKKVPVTSPEACQHLLDTMDSTQDNMVRLLQATLISLPQAMQQEDDAERAKAEAKAAEDAEKEAARQAEEEAKAAAEATAEDNADDSADE